MSVKLTGHITDDGLPDLLVAVVRGGMVPATIIAHHLRIRDVRCLQVRHTVGEEIGSPKSASPSIHHPHSLSDVAGTDVLIVDDVVGSGKTLSFSGELLDGLGAARIRTAVLAVNLINWRREHSKPPANDPVRLLDYVGSLHEGWVICPWELQ
ncbi:MULTISPECIES: phosphoribosyltransferase [Streptomyces]